MITGKLKPQRKVCTDTDYQLTESMYCRYDHRQIINHKEIRLVQTQLINGLFIIIVLHCSYDYIYV